MSGGPSVKELSSKIIKDGYLSKQGMRTARWQQRWFVLTLDNMLYYFKSETAESPKGAINLKKYTHVSSGKKPMSFFIYHDRDATKRVYYMASELATEMQEWMTEIDNGIKRAAGVLLALDDKSKFNGAQLARMLSLTVVEARNLTGKDPYVIAQLATRYVRTRTIQKTQDPFWGDSYVMEVDDEVKEKSLELQVTIMDDDWFALKDRVLGKVVVPLNSLQNGKLHEQWYPLVPTESEAIVAGMLNLRVEYVNRTLNVRVVQGRELASRNSDGSSDPFVEVKVDGQAQKTQVVKKTLNPFWNKKLSFHVDKLPERIQVISNEVVVGNKFLGEVFVALSETDLVEKVDRWYMLSSGKIHQSTPLKKAKSGSALELSSTKKGGSFKRSSDPSSPESPHLKAPASLKHSPSMPLARSSPASVSSPALTSSAAITSYSLSPSPSASTINSVSSNQGPRSLIRQKDSSLTRISVMNGIVPSPSVLRPATPSPTSSSPSPSPSPSSSSSSGNPPSSPRQNKGSSCFSSGSSNSSPILHPRPNPTPQPPTSSTSSTYSLSQSSESTPESPKSELLAPKEPTSSTNSSTTSPTVSSSSSASSSSTSSSSAASSSSSTSGSTKPLGDIRLKIRFMASVILPFGSYERLLELLLDEKCDLAIALGEVVAPDERENLATNLVKIFTCRFSILTLLKRLTEEEINNTPDPDIIFRSNSLATKAVEYYMRLAGSTYLTKTIGPSIRSIISQKRTYEVDSSKAEKDDDIEGNQKRLISLAEGVSLDIFQSEVSCPTNFREIFSHLQDTVVKKWGYGATSEKIRYSVVSGFLFLRFFCPAILGPKLFNLMDNFADPKTGRTFTLLSKIMQNLANLVEFGQKEPYMAAINPFVTSNFPNMRSFFDKIATPPRGNWPGFVDGDHPQIHLQKEMAFLHSYLLRHKTAILSQSSLAGVKDKLVAVLNELDAVIMKELKDRRAKN